MKPPLQLKFRRNMRVGAADAEHDTLLQEAFFDDGALAIAQDTDDSRAILVGRTGTGKTALLLRLEETVETCLRIRPESLSMHYISNSTIIPYLSQLGVHLDLFYKLLWRHVLVVDLIRTHFDLDNPTKQQTFRNKLTTIFAKDRAKKSSISYLEEWGGQFWEEADRQVQEIVSTLESNVTSGLSMGSKDLAAIAQVRGGAGASTTTKEQVRQRAQTVVNKIQLKRLDDAFRILRDDVLTDSQHSYLILIDDLDRAWVEESYAYDLIDALLQEVGEFARLKNVKVIVALRENILRKLYRRASTKRQQREKYETLCLRLSWDKANLIKMIDLRLDRLFKEQRGRKVTLESILPPARKGSRKSDTGVNYMLQRTFDRPRDLIHFLNFALEESADKQRVGWKELTKAERRYSAERLNSLVDEWSENYPGIEAIVDALKGITDGFLLHEFDEDRVMRVLIAGEGDDGKNTEPGHLNRLYLEKSYGLDSLRRNILNVLFEIGSIGLKPTPQDRCVYCYEDPHLLEREIGDGARVYVHPALHRALDIHP